MLGSSGNIPTHPSYDEHNAGIRRRYTQQIDKLEEIRRCALQLDSCSKSLVVAVQKDWKHEIQFWLRETTEASQKLQEAFNAARESGAPQLAAGFNLSNM